MQSLQLKWQIEFDYATKKETEEFVFKLEEDQLYELTTSGYSAKNYFKWHNGLRFEDKFNWAHDSTKFI